MLNIETDRVSIFVIIQTMKIIEKKILTERFQKIKDGNKKYELRLADFGIESGDKLILKEWDPTSKTYTGRELEKIATHILKTKDINYWTKEEVEEFGYLIIFFD